MCTYSVGIAYTACPVRSCGSLFLDNVILSLVKNEHAGEEGPHSPAGQFLVDLVCFYFYSIISVVIGAGSF